MSILSSNINAAAAPTHRMGLLTRLTTCVALGLVSACATLPKPGSVHRLESQVVGAWRLVKTEQRLQDGTVRPKPAYGPHGLGYIIYDPSHVMCVFLANPDAPRTPLNALRGEPGSSMDSPASYCGRWHIEADGPKIVHSTELDVFPEYIGQQRARLFRRDGDRLYLRPTGSTPGVIDYFLLFERVR